MFSKLTIQKNIWIGAAIGAVVIAALLAISAGIVVSGTIGCDKEILLVCGAICFGTIVGGMIAAGKKREPKKSLLCAVIIYVVMWIIAVASGRTICFDTTAITSTICVFAGSIIGCIARPSPKSRKRKSQKSLKKERHGSKR